MVVLHGKMTVSANLRNTSATIAQTNVKIPARKIPYHQSRRRENMVGVNMVLAEFIKLIHGLRVLF